MFDKMETAGFNLDRLFLNADAGFDVQKFKELCFCKGIIYNIDSNKRSSVQVK